MGTARTGKEGLHLFKALSPDLVTLDLMMPVMNGMDVLMELMKQEKKT